MYTEHRPAFQAKNRYDLPFELPVSWQAFDEARNASASTDCTGLVTEAMNLSDMVSDMVIRAKVVDSIANASTHPQQLEAIIARIKQITNQGGAHAG